MIQAMNMHLAKLASLLCVLTASTPANAAPLQPTGKWSVDFGDAHCIATRNYGTEAAPLILALKPAAVGDVMQLSVLRKGGNREVGEYAGAMTIDGAPPVPISLLGYAGSSGKTRVAAINLPLALFKPVESAATLRLRSSTELDHVFALSDMVPLVGALDRCVTDLRQHWNIAGATAAIATPARSKRPLRDLFASRDYPRVALRAGASGTVELMLLIDEAGKVASCMVIASSGYASLDAQSCAIIGKGAVFTPALGRDRKTVRSGSIHRIRWQRSA